MQKEPPKVFLEIWQNSQENTWPESLFLLSFLTKFTEKHLYQNLFFYKVAGLRQRYEKKTLAQVLSCEFRQISNNTFFTEHLWMTASINDFILD